MSERCGCTMSKGRLKERIKAYDFALHEMNLYLDVNPCDKGAMELMRAYRQKRKELVEVYEANFGPYVVRARDVEGERWCWVDDPWPWDITGKE